MDTDAGDETDGGRRARGKAVSGATKEETGDTADKTTTKNSDSEDASDSEDDSDTTGCDFCKPLATFVGERVAAQEGFGGGLPAGRVLYGNDGIYLFFRLHQLLYDRLRQARRCIADKDKPTFRQTGEAPQEDQVGGGVGWGRWGVVTCMWGSVDMYVEVCGHVCTQHVVMYCSLNAPLYIHTPIQ